MKLPYPITLPPEESPEDQFRRAMIEHDIDPPPQITLDGEIHRYGPKGNSWYVGWPDLTPAGSAGDWALGISFNWSAKGTKSRSLADEMQIRQRVIEAKEKNEKARIEAAKGAAETASIIWDSLGLASEAHPYLARKGVKPHIARVTGDGRLAVPMYDSQGELTSLQYISGDGDKRFHPGGRVKGSFCAIGNEDSQHVYICEGFATGATIQEETEGLVFIAFSAGNIVETARIVREKYKEKSVSIVADNDKSGVGKSYADQAAALYSMRVIMPPNIKDGDTDINDFRKSGGDVKSILLPQNNDDWLIQIDDFASKKSSVEWYIKKWIQKNATMMLFGPSGSGKSFVVIDMAMRLATGQSDWMGHKIKPCPVVYLAGEGHEGIRGRVTAWKQYHHVTEKADMWISKTGKSLNTEVFDVIESIKKLPKMPGLVIVDTLHRFLDGDENDASDVRSMIIACDKIRESTGASVILIHHTGVSEEAQHRGRGSSAWKGSMDVEINVRKDKNEITIKETKVKDGEEMGPYTLSLDSVPIEGWYDEDGEPVTSAVITGGQEKTSINSALYEKIKMIKDAWYDTGEEQKGDYPYISRSGCRQYLIARHGKDPKKDAQTIKKMLSPSEPGRWIGKLLDEKIIKEDDEKTGYLIISDDVISTIHLLGVQGYKGGTN